MKNFLFFTTKENGTKVIKPISAPDYVTAIQDYYKHNRMFAWKIVEGHIDQVKKEVVGKVLFEEVK